MIDQTGSPADGAEPSAATHPPGIQHLARSFDDLDASDLAGADLAVDGVGVDAVLSQRALPQPVDGTDLDRLATLARRVAVAERVVARTQDRTARQVVDRAGGTESSGVALHTSAIRDAAAAVVAARAQLADADAALAAAERGEEPAVTTDPPDQEADPGDEDHDPEADPGDGPATRHDDGDTDDPATGSDPSGDADDPTGDGGDDRADPTGAAAGRGGKRPADEAVQGRDRAAGGWSGDDPATDPGEQDEVADDRASAWDARTGRRRSLAALLIGIGAGLVALGFGAPGWTMLLPVLAGLVLAALALRVPRAIREATGAVLPREQGPEGAGRLAEVNVLADRALAARIAWRTPTYDPGDPADDAPTDDSNWPTGDEPTDDGDRDGADRDDLADADPNPPADDGSGTVGADDGPAGHDPAHDAGPAPGDDGAEGDGGPGSGGVDEEAVALRRAARDLAVEEVRVAERAWWSLAGDGVDPDDVEEVVRRHDPQHRDALALAAEATAVRAAGRLLDRARQGWADGWTGLGLEPPAHDARPGDALADLDRRATAPVVLADDAVTWAERVASALPAAPVLVLVGAGGPDPAESTDAGSPPDQGSDSGHDDRWAPS